MSRYNFVADASSEATIYLASRATAQAAIFKKVANQIIEK